MFVGRIPRQIYLIYALQLGLEIIINSRYRFIRRPLHAAKRRQYEAPSALGGITRSQKRSRILALRAFYRPGTTRQLRRKPHRVSERFPASDMQGFVKRAESELTAAVIDGIRLKVSTSVRPKRLQHRHPLVCDLLIGCLLGGLLLILEQ
jgi:hypothetical protein